MGDFGAKFRKARESKELSLDDISNVTKISARMLQAIEEEDFDQLPGGVFNKGFIRAYAKHLGLNSDDAVNEYLACLRQAQIDSHAGWDSGVRPDPRTAKVPLATPPKPTPRVEHPVEVDELPELQLPRAEDIRQRSQFDRVAQFGARAVSFNISNAVRVDTSRSLRRTLRFARRANSSRFTSASAFPRCR